MTATQRSATAVRSARSLTVALVVIGVVAVVLALTIVLATAGGDGDERAPVHVAPSAPLPPSPAERDQPPGQWGPGFRP